MIRLALILATLTALGACGVDGPPERPKATAAATIGSNGSVAMGVGMAQGPASLFLSI